MADAKKPANVFLTWSGERSGAVAQALHGWLPQVIQQCRPWLSKKDIYAGRRWRAEVRQSLDTIKVGVLCLTPENVEKPWVNFEAGALAKQVDDYSRVIPYCFGLKPTDYADPLGDFQGIETDKDGTLSLVQSINAAMPDPLDPAVLTTVFKRAWPDFEVELGKIPRDHPSVAPRSTGSLLEEILTRVRGLEYSGRTLLIPVEQENVFDRTRPLESMFGKGSLAAAAGISTVARDRQDDPGDSGKNR